MVGVEQWAEIHRLQFVKGLSQREIHRRTALHRDTIRQALASTNDDSLDPALVGRRVEVIVDQRLSRRSDRLQRSAAMIYRIA